MYFYSPRPYTDSREWSLIRNNKTHIGPHRLLLKWIAVSSFRTFQNQGDSNRVHVRWILVGRRWKLLFPNECVLFVWDTWQDIFVGEVAFTCPGMARIVVRTKDSHPCLWLRWFGMLPHGWRNWKVIFQQAVKRCEMTICGLCVVVKRGNKRKSGPNPGSRKALFIFTFDNVVRRSIYNRTIQSTVIPIISRMPQNEVHMHCVCFCRGRVCQRHCRQVTSNADDQRRGNWNSKIKEAVHTYLSAKFRRSIRFQKRQHLG